MVWNGFNWTLFVTGVPRAGSLGNRSDPAIHQGRNRIKVLQYVLLRREYRTISATSSHGSRVRRNFTSCGRKLNSVLGRTINNLRHQRKIPATPMYNPGSKVVVQVWLLWCVRLSVGSWWLSAAAGRENRVFWTCWSAAVSLRCMNRLSSKRLPFHLTSTTSRCVL